MDKKSEIELWKRTFDIDYKQITGKLPISKMEYKYLLLELKKLEYSELVTELMKRKNDLIESH